MGEALTLLCGDKSYFVLLYSLCHHVVFFFVAGVTLLLPSYIFWADRLCSGYIAIGTPDAIFY